MGEQLRHFPDNGEPKPQTLAVVTFRVPDLAELLENRLVHFRTNTSARVRNLQPNPPLFLMPHHPDLTARRRVLDGVRNKIPYHARQQRRVASYPERAVLNRELKFFLRRLNFKLLAHGIKQTLRRETIQIRSDY